MTKSLGPDLGYVGPKEWNRLHHLPFRRSSSNNLDWHAPLVKVRPLAAWLDN